MEQKRPIFDKKRTLKCPFSSFLQKKLIKKGNFKKAKQIWSKTIATAEKLAADKSVNIWSNSFRKVLPKIDFKKTRIGGKVVEIPCPIRRKRKFFLSFKWILEEARSRSKISRPISKKLASELVDIQTSSNSSVLIKKREWQRHAKKNLRFLRYRWS